MVLAEITGLFLSWLARLITGAQGHWKGCPPTSEQRIYFANHQSHFDWVLIWASLPGELRARTRPIAARDYWTSSALKTWLTTAVFNAVYVSRTRATPDEDPLEPLVDALQGGDSLVIFPEGTRSNKGNPMPFKSGIYHLARQRPELEFVPVWIDNLKRVMPKGRFLPLPLLCTATFGTPLRLRADEDKAAFLARSRQALLDLAPNGGKA